MTFIDAAPKLTEAQFQSQVIKLAKLCGWAVWHDVATNTPRRCAECGAIRSTPRNAAGHPDLILIRRPRILWVEVKAQRTPVTPAQLDWIGELRACGQEAYIWRPRMWEIVERTLAR